MGEEISGSAGVIITPDIPPLGQVARAVGWGLSCLPTTMIKSFGSKWPSDRSGTGVKDAAAKECGGIMQTWG
jgi:hypothetical protein